jgi:alpha-N-acetylglucosaminidase
MYQRMIIAHSDRALGRGSAVSRQNFLHLVLILIYYSARRHKFLLGLWFARARRCGRTGPAADYYERNAREIITSWHSASNGLRDCASRQ